MNIITLLGGLSLLASTSIPRVPIKTEAHVGTDTTIETLQFDFMDLKAIKSIDFTYMNNDKKEITDIKMRIQYRISKDIYSSFLEEDPETIFGIGIYLVDKNLSTDTYDKQGIYLEQPFSEVFENDLDSGTFKYLECGPRDYVFLGEDLKEIDSRYASYIQYAQVFNNMLGENETREIACFAFMESSGTLVVNSTEIVSVKSIAEEYVRTGKTPHENLSDEAIEALCLHFNLNRPWYHNYFKTLFSKPSNWKTPQWVTAGVGTLILLCLAMYIFRKH